MLRISHSPTKAGGPDLYSISTVPVEAQKFVAQSQTLIAPTVPGKYYVWVIADDFGKVTNQSDTSDDIQPSAMFTVAGATADLVPLDLTPSSTTVTAGASFTATWTLANVGNAAANAASTTILRINQSQTTAAPKINLAGVDTPALAAGNSVQQSATLAAPTTPGTYYLWAIADDFSQVTNQTNMQNDLQHSAAFTVVAAPGSLQLAMTTYTYTILDYPSVYRTFATGINNDAKVVGNNNNGSSWTYDPASGTFTPLSPSVLGGIYANSLNNTGQIVGQYYPGAPADFQSFLYTGGTYSDFRYTNAQGGQYSDTIASGINDLGQIVGSYPVNGVRHGFLYSGGAFTTLDDPLALGAGTVAYGINDAGQVVGIYNNGSGATHGFLYSAGTYTTLDDPSGTSTYANAINNLGQIVGQYTRATDGSTHSFLYSNGTYTPLDDPSGIETIARGINDAGQIVGYFVNGSAWSGFLANPTNNPLTAGISASGPQGGPFAPASFTYALTANNGTADFQIVNLPSWLTASQTTGTATTTPANITFTVNAGANALAPGVAGPFTFSIVNTTNGQGTQDLTAQITVLNPNVPANDNFANAATLLLGQTVSAGNFGATKEAGEPDHAGNAGGHSVWWNLTPTASGQIVVTTAGSDFDTLLAVYTGNSVGALTPVQSNDDTPGGAGTSLLSFAATAGTTYRIAVDGKSGATGHIALIAASTDTTGATLSISPATGIEALGKVGGPFGPSPFTFAISTSSGTADFQITNVPSWLTASPTSGTASATPTNITFTVNASANSLGAGHYGAPVLFTASTAGGQNSQLRLASLTVNSPASSVSFQGLGFLPGTGISDGANHSEANAVSGDGNVAVGAQILSAPERRFVGLMAV